MSRASLRRLHCLGIIAVATMALSACGTHLTSAGTESSTTPTAVPPTATPQPPCTQYVAGSQPFQGLSAVPGIQFPSGTYISEAATSGGGTGQYKVATYTLCFKGTESA